MADWRQIQARIRKAKNGRDPSAKLSELYQRTRDAMVAWELGAIEEKAERQDEATKWYTIAAQRFRRADWKKKAEEALVRLGAPLPPQPERSQTPRENPPEEHPTPPAEEKTLHAAPEIPEEEPDYESQTKFFGTANLDQRHEDRAAEPGEFSPTDVQPDASAQPAQSGDKGESGKRKRRRGRRGGRGRRRKGAGGAPGLPSQAFAQPSESHEEHPAAAAPPEESTQESPKPVREDVPAPQLPSERMAHGRAGEPALASRMNQLESLLRRLLGSALHRLNEADEAPAGPGVFLLSESDQTTSYYVEACQTLRVGIANLGRGGRGGKGRSGGRGVSEVDLKGKLAEHLGINEAKVAQYLKDHCAVRWLQLDDEAPQLAHFAIAVLRTPLNLG